MISGSSDKTIRVWDMKTKACIVIISPLPAGWVAFTPGNAYKSGGEINGGFWYNAGLCRFDPEEFKDLEPAIRCVPDDEPM